MKKIYFLVTILISIVTFAQVPQGISYQAIALNSSGNPVVSSNVGIRLSVLDNSATGTVLYTETQTKTTNTQGLFNLVIGQGTPSTGTFSTINWGTNSKFLKVEMDVAGGTNYALVGTTQLLSVPYALAAGSFVSTNGNSLINQVNRSKISNFAFIDNGANIAYVFNSNSSTWSSQSFNGSYTPTLEISNGNFAFIDNGADIAYVYNSNFSTWSSQSFNGSYTPTLVNSNGNFAFIDNGANIVYTYNSVSSAWSSQSFDGSYTPTLEISNGNFAFIDNGANIAYVYNSNSSTWSSQSFNGSYTPTLLSSNGNFAFIDNGANIAYTYNSDSNTWFSQSFDGSYTPSIIISGN